MNSEQRAQLTQIKQKLEDIETDLASDFENEIEDERIDDAIFNAMANLAATIEHINHALGEPT